MGPVPPLFPLGVRRLPYTAEVQYLQSSGTQYFDTGYAFTDGYTFELDFDGIESTKSVIGARDNNVRTSVLYYSGTYGFAVNIAGFTAQTTPFKLSPVVPTSRMTFKMTVKSGKGSIWIDGTAKYTNKAFSGPYVSGVTMALFATKYGDGDFREITASKVYSLKMWQGGALVRDYQPVRVGTTGELFDRVTGAFAARVGTFSIGPDKT